MSRPQANPTEEKRRELRSLDVSAHWLEGGTFITNLNEDWIPAVEQAVKEYGDPRLVVHPEPCRGGAGIKGWKSLHWLQPQNGLRGRWPSGESLSPFWRLVDHIRGKPANWTAVSEAEQKLENFGE